DSASVTDPDHYRLLPSGNVEAVLPQDEDFREVELVLSGHSLAGGFGKAAYLEVNQLKNREGKWLIETQKFNLFRAASDLSNLIVYPQPVNPHQRELIFARIPSDAEITIYNLSGKPVRSLTESAYGGMHWDLKDDTGREVATGVYFYRIKYRNQQKIGKVMIVR
ncbi:MAG TPA: T9SS type A sorting domain-containing protein, partial [Caldithrix abyssi]|nr:T9SS type A sorting domain-containing protein [Caldithrix abyssi]